MVLYEYEFGKKEMRTFLAAAGFLVAREFVVVRERRCFAQFWRLGWPLKSFSLQYIDILPISGFRFCLSQMSIRVILAKNFLERYKAADAG